MMVDFLGGSSRRKPDRIKIYFEGRTDRIYHRAPCGGRRKKRRDQEFPGVSVGCTVVPLTGLRDENQRFNFGC